MCRLLGWVSSRPRTLDELLGADELAAFTELSRRHGDGWGIAWLDDDGGVEVCKEAGAAYASRAYWDAVRTVRTRAAIVHLRWATPGLAVRSDNTHPFRYDGAAFAHNGAIRPVDGLLSLLPDQARTTLEGDTDSERYFRIALDRAQRAGEVAGFRRAIADIGTELTPSSLNAMLLTREALVAVCCHDPNSAPTHPARAAVAAAAGGPPEHLRGYFDLHYRTSADAVLVTSSGWLGSGWETISNGCALVADTARLNVTVLDVGQLPESALRRAETARVAAVEGWPSPALRPPSEP